jgi:ribosomal protein S18 acetylase RimI-like enzyme
MDQRAIATIVAAFIADPVERWLWPEPSQYLTHFPAFVEAYGAGATVSSLDGAVAVWIAPGVELNGAGIVAVLRDTVAPERHEDAFATVAQMDDLHPKERHWYLPWLAVDPPHQSAGLGGRLLDRGLEQVDADHLPAFLETPNPRTVPFYERHGFSVIGVARAGGCPPLTSMLRPAP